MSNSSTRDTILFDDAKLIDCRNGAPAAGSVLKEEIDALVSNACRYRPIYTMWGGSDITNHDTFLGQYWLNVSPASPGISGMFLILPSTGVVNADQSVAMTVGGVGADYSHTAPAQYDAANPLRYPNNAHGSVPLHFPLAADNAPHQVALGSHTANGPQLRAACLYEAINATPTQLPADAPQTINDEWLSPGSWILGTGQNDARYRSIRAVRDYWRRVYKARRLAFGWSAVSGASPYDGALKFTSVTHKYFFDQGYGEGATAPTPTTPGITVPLKNAASGRNTTQRLYMAIHARQTGGGTGSLRYYHRADDGTSMVGPLAPANDVAITSSSWNWYGISSPFAEASDMYMTGNATLDYDRIIPCGGASSGQLEIDAFSIYAFHSER